MNKEQQESKEYQERVERTLANVHETSGKWRKTTVTETNLDGTPINTFDGKTGPISELIDFAEERRKTSGCWECREPTEAGIWVADGHRGSIKTGATKLWNFCWECGQLKSPEHLKCYSTLFTTTTTEYYSNGDEPRVVESNTCKEAGEYAIPDHVYTINEAREIIARILNC